ncbi:MAG: hypothetical protein FWD13_12655 [Treponema sp.]|nr:hypothetical protein [Treponema sp.]
MFVKKLCMGILAMALVFGFTLTGCGNLGEIDDPAIIGTWKLTEIDNINPSEDLGLDVEIKLNRNGSFEATAKVDLSGFLDELLGIEDGGELDFVMDIITDIFGDDAKLTVGARGNYDAKEGEIKIRPDAVRADFLRNAIDEVIKLIDKDDEIVEMLLEMLEEFEITKEKVKGLLTVVRNNTSGWIGKTQIRNILKHLTDNFADLLGAEGVAELNNAYNNYDNYLKDLHAAIPTIPYNINGDKLGIESVIIFTKK